MTNVSKHWIVKWTCKETIVLKHTLYGGNNLEEYWVHEMTSSSTNCWCLLSLTITFKTYIKLTWDFFWRLRQWLSQKILCVFLLCRKSWVQFPESTCAHVYVCMFLTPLFLLKKHFHKIYFDHFFSHPSHLAPPHLRTYPTIFFFKKNCM